jgi:uncharacterized surface protein with fasciclin (FAS1) repeats
MAPQTKPPEHIVEIARQHDKLSTFVEALFRADVNEILESGGPYTVFAPVDSAFDALPDDQFDQIWATEHKSRLTSVLKHHIVPAEVRLERIRDGQMTTLGRRPVPTAISGDDRFFGHGRITRGDIACNNGLIHVVDRVFVP